MKSPSLCIILLVVFASCSRKSESVLYDEGNAAQTQKNFQLAVDRYQEIVDRYPKNTYAESSLFRMAVIYNNDLHDNAKAIKAYRTLWSMFPASGEAPNALFLVGFLYNNELHNIDSARTTYELFLQKYPAHSLAPSAKYELETLGKDPTQLLQSGATAKGTGQSAEPSGASNQ